MVFRRIEKKKRIALLGDVFLKASFLLCSLVVGLVPLNCLCVIVCSAPGPVNQLSTDWNNDPVPLGCCLSLIANLWNQDDRKKLCRSNLDCISHVSLYVCLCQIMFQMILCDCRHTCKIRKCMYVCLHVYSMGGWLFVCAWHANRTSVNARVLFLYLDWAARRQRDVEEKHFKQRLTLKQNLHVFLLADAYFLKPFICKLDCTECRIHVSYYLYQLSSCFSIFQIFSDENSQKLVRFDCLVER